MIIELKGRYLDKDTYNKQLLLLQKIIEYGCSEILKKYGFEKHKDKYILKEMLLSCKIEFNCEEIKNI